MVTKVFKKVMSSFCITVKVSCLVDSGDTLKPINSGSFSLSSIQHKVRAGDIPFTLAARAGHLMGSEVGSPSPEPVGLLGPRGVS